jgi:sialate O-acetylesterase
MPVGERLANYALGDTYGKAGFVYKTPLYKAYKIEKSKVRITFDNVPTTLIAQGGEPTEFMVAGEDQNFVPAKAKIEGNSVVVYSKEVKAPVAVRFGWPNGSIPNLFSTEGMPVSCFRTDDWPILK